MVDKNALWSKVILAKYGSNAKQWRFGVNNLKDMSTIWRGIVENSFDARVNIWMGDKDFKWKVGNGKYTLFWGDHWCGGFCNVNWEGFFVRALLDREWGMISRLLDWVGGMVLIPEVEDRILWKHDKNGEFSVKQLTKLMVDGVGVDFSFTFDRIWKLKVPPKVRYFLWLIAIDRVPTKDFLIKKGVKILDTVNDIGWKRVKNFEEFYSCCFKVKILGSCKSLWLIAIAAAVWSIWLARNEMVFENKVLTMDTLVFHAKVRALLWSRAAFDECRFHERLWWLCPYKCRLSKSDPGGWCFPLHGWFKFNVSGIVFEGVQGGGGVLRGEDGIVRALFSSPIDAGDAESTELGAIIIALDIIIEIGWKRTGSFIIEIGSREVISWILEKTRRRWSHQVIFAKLERR
ncbi:hypothetical protein PVK06_018588 [Gossypium arboreum]|uniref:Reverse transcriptase zinc-binding domain-containing protein n=1 Tax=Gossypium arboreum TaxID=29729 RepID=A0ABR0PHK8_GOSAR|nr:hypothetical protein PVK06_018588 [Gossypium arboreum]